VIAERARAIEPEWATRGEIAELMRCSEWLVSRWTAAHEADGRKVCRGAGRGRRWHLPTVRSLLRAEMAIP